MRSIYTIVIILAIPFYLSAQTTTFEYLLSSPKNERVIDIYESDNGEIYFSGFISDHWDYRIQRNALLGKIDEYGQFIDSIVVSYPEMCFAFTSIIPTEDSMFILDGTKNDTSGQFQNAGIVLTKFKSDLSFVEKKEYTFPPDYKVQLHFAYKSQSNRFLVAGAFNLTPDPTKTFVYQFNENLDSLRAKFFLDNNLFFGGLKELSNSKLWILPAIKFNYVIIDSTWSEVTEYDMPVFINSAYGFEWDTDTSFYLVGEYFPVPPAEDNKDIGIIRQFHPTDTSGFLFKSWGKIDTVDHPAVWGALDFKTKDSVYIGGATNLGPNYYGTWPSWYFVIQTDSMLNVRWERFYGGDAYYLMQKIITTNDGGCLIAGTRYDYQNTTEEELDIHILKLNNEGLFVGNQNDINIEIREAIIFPNPGTNNLKVRIAAQYPLSTFELYDINGKQVLTEQITGKWGDINTSFLKAGTYVYRIHNVEGLFETGKWVKQ